MYFFFFLTKLKSSRSTYLLKNFLSGIVQVTDHHQISRQLIRGLRVKSYGKKADTLEARATFPRVLDRISHFLSFGSKLSFC